MPNSWIFFRDVFGRWQWEQHGSDSAVVGTTSSSGSFKTPVDCLHDALRHGYLPMKHPAVFPPEFKDTAGEDVRADANATS